MRSATPRHEQQLTVSADVARSWRSPRGAVERLSAAEARDRRRVWLEVAAACGNKSFAARFSSIARNKNSSACAQPRNFAHCVTTAAARRRRRPTAETRARAAFESRCAWPFLFGRRGARRSILRLRSFVCARRFCERVDRRFSLHDTRRRRP